MAITRLPGVRVIESSTAPDYTGTGARIPVIIGKSKNTIASSAISIQKYTNWSDINKARDSDTKRGVGVYTGTASTDGELLTFLHEFYEEAETINSEDIGVPHIYVIDLGNAITSPLVISAMDLCKSIKGIDMEVYVGLTTSVDDGDEGTVTIQSLMATCYTKIASELQFGDIRTSYWTATDALTDANIIALNSSAVQKSRTYIAEPELFGKTIARICTTPYDTEVGYLEYRSVEPGTFKSRSDTEKLALQNAGIIFNADETKFNKTWVRINRGVSTAFGKTVSERPNDALLHARYNADQCVNRCVAEIYPQLKANETVTSISRQQTKVDKIVDDEIEKGAMMKGSKIIVTESDIDAYLLKLESKLIPVNATNNVDITVYVAPPNTVASE